ncbi:AAA family ATPase [Mesorhizobium sp. Z1-4]|uniref:AAA family ATPase n=1 Tax=Mesorhizobium sp. Z1-4 TaxID=2448478 RepID=UPI0013DF2745|nr:AAA family ATPase [Mesorhizobium sp. Z1-4]
MSAIPPIQDFEAFEKATVEFLKPPFRPHFPAVPWGERGKPRKRLQYLVEDWISTTGASVVGGRSGCGKSFFALHLAMCVCRGVDFFGLAVRRAGVIYQAGEGGYGLYDREEAYARHFEVKDDEKVPFMLVPVPIDILTKDKKDVDNFIADVRGHSEQMESKFGVPAGLIVIDTLKKAAPGIDEINGKDYAVVVANVYRIERETGCHVMLVHHTNAGGNKLRGNTSIRDDVDQVILIDHDKQTGIRDAVLDKIKDGEDGKKIRFTLISVPVRMEARSDGTDKEITSCAVVTVTEKDRLKKEQERQGFSVNPTERRILMNLFDAADRYGKFVASEADGPKAAIGRIVIGWDVYRDIALEKMPEVEDRKKARDQIRQEFKRAKDALLRYGIIGVSHPYMWWDGKPVRGFTRTFKRGQNADETRTNAGQSADQQLSPGERDMFDDPDIPL